jgi:hypothetical protein
MNYRGMDYGPRSMSECKGHRFFSLLRRLGADWFSEKGHDISSTSTQCCQSARFCLELVAKLSGALGRRKGPRLVAPDSRRLSFLLQ